MISLTLASSLGGFDYGFSAAVAIPPVPASGIRMGRTASVFHKDSALRVHKDRSLRVHKDNALRVHKDSALRVGPEEVTKGGNDAVRRCVDLLDPARPDQSAVIVAPVEPVDFHHSPAAGSVDELRVPDVDPHV